MALSERPEAIEDSPEFKITELKVARDGNVHEQFLDETEVNLKFGLFILTLMYFRAMTFLSKKEKMEMGQDILEAGDDRLMTEEKLNQLMEENKANIRKKKVDVVLARVKVGEARRQG